MATMDANQAARMLKQGSLEEQLSAAQWLANSPQADQAIEALLEHITSRSEDVREWCSEALENMQHVAPGRLPVLVPFLTAYLEGRAHPDQAFWTATLLGRLGPAAAPAAETLAQVVQLPTTDPVRHRAAWALGQIGPSAAVAIPALEHAARATDQPRLSRTAQQSLAAILG